MDDVVGIEDYYFNNSSRKVSDFCIGFFGIFAVFLIIGILFSLIFAYLNSISYVFLPLSWLVMPLSIAILMLGTVISFKKGRRYIGIGIISSTLVPFLVFGACLLIFFGAGGLG